MAKQKGTVSNARGELVDVEVEVPASAATLFPVEPPQTYTVAKHLHGILVRGSIPVSELVALSHCWQSLGFDLCDARIAERLAASFCFTNAVHSLAWRKELGIS